MAKNIYYGLSSFKALEEIAAQVVEVLGGGDDAFCLIMETCAAETHLGTAPDLHSLSGYGLTQFDNIGFDDTVNRTGKVRRDQVFGKWRIDINEIMIRELNFSPMLSVILCRLFYLLRPGKIPDTLEGRAAYWKKYYNTEYGKGTIEHYIKSSRLLKDLSLIHISEPTRPY